MDELDELERALMKGAQIWFNQGLQQKLQRLIAIARGAKARSAPETDANQTALNQTLDEVIRL